MAMTWWQYVEEVSGGATQDAIARTVGNITSPSVGRWKKSEPKPSSVAAFARAYGRPVLEAFVAAGFLTDDDARTQVTTVRHEDPSDEELLDLLRRRLERDQRSSDGHQSAPTSPVTPLHPEPVSDPDASLYLAADDRDPREEQEGRDD